MAIEQSLRDYAREVAACYGRGDAREESYYGALKRLLEQSAEQFEHQGLQVTVLPRPTEAGNPDFRVWNGANRIVGYLEAKAPTVRDLDSVEQSSQLARYREVFPNLILTNFLEFRLYRDGELSQSARVGGADLLDHPGKKIPAESITGIEDLLRKFFAFSVPRTFSAQSLAFELARRTGFLREIVSQQLQEEKAKPGELSGFFDAFRTYLIGSLDEDEFADLYAQTITYGLFAARTRTNGTFTRRKAFDAIPRTVGVLRDVFRYVSLGSLPDQMVWIVDDIAAVLAAAEVRNILEEYYHQHRGSDPVVHFYETFLAQYNPEERERRGVYYTPEPVVDYIVRGVDHLLKTKFGKPDGLASREVTLLDPAAGTMSFVARAAQQAVNQFTAKYGKASREALIREHILKNFYAFELMMAPYAIGHLKMGFYLEELGYRLRDQDRVPFFLTNTLDMSELHQSALPGISALAEESHLAGKVKKQTPILVILGNPPYSGHSANRSQIERRIEPGQPYTEQTRGGRMAYRKAGPKGAVVKQKTFIGRLIEDYKRVDGGPLGEKNPKWLQDDYVKFLRFAQWKIEQSGRGIVAMITNHSYLDNPTFRGMRQSLMQSFDEIYILDLHGNSLKRETCPDGSPDENVFDIRQGVAIAFFARYGDD